jgi:uncharacterized protein (DUF433 family)
MLSPFEMSLAKKAFHLGGDIIPRNSMTVVAGRIEINPAVMLGKPVIRVPRIKVELLLRKLAAGASEADLLDAYPNLSTEDIRAAITYAADTIAHEELIEGSATN